MTIKARLAQLEKRRNEQPFKPPEIIEIYGTREDGTQYLISTWKQLIDADNSGHLENCPQWQEFTSDEPTQPLNPA